MKNYVETIPNKIQNLFLENYQTNKKRYTKLLRENNIFEKEDILDVSFLPRVFTRSYLNQINKFSYCLFKLFNNFIQIGAQNIKQFPISEHSLFLLDEIGVFNWTYSDNQNLKKGIMRFDYGIVGKPDGGNLPKLLEVNILGCGALSYSYLASSFLCQVFPELEQYNSHLNPLDKLYDDLKSIGGNIVIITNRRPNIIEIDVSKILKLGKNFYEIHRDNIEDRLFFDSNKLFLRDGKNNLNIMGAYLMDLDDSDSIKTHSEFIKKLLRSDVIIHDSYALQLCEDKIFLVLLSDKNFRGMFLTEKENEFLDGVVLDSCFVRDYKKFSKPTVLKKVNEHGGRGILFPDNINNEIKKLGSLDEWILQERIDLNKVVFDSVTSGKGVGLSDFGVFYSYEFEGSNITRFENVGFLGRTSPNDYRVNISQGGIVLPIFIE